MNQMPRPIGSKKGWELKLVTIKSKKEIELMKEACRITALAHKEVEKHLRIGVSTKKLDEVAEKTILENGAIPSFKGYPSGLRNIIDFPATACISINDEVIHGIPSEHIVLKDGDVVSVDLGAYKNGFHGDSARTYIIGNGNEEVKRLIDTTRKSFFEGIKYAKIGYRIGDVSHAIGEFVKKNGYSVVKDFQGHGVGKELHEDPGIPNYGKQGVGIRLEPGMTLAIEPMVNKGNSGIFVLENGWTVVTEDGSLSAHYENTILITEKEPEILTII